MIDKKVAIIGFGREGESTAQYALDQGAKVTVCDKLSLEDLGARYEQWQEKVGWRLGDDYLKNLTDFDIIFRSPGVKSLLPELEEARNAGVQVTSQTREFFSHSPCPIIGVTGTKGKGTTATLVHKILLADNKDAVLVGNIGSPALSALPQIDKDSLVVYELSSFQLQDLTHSPHVSVVLGITRDHQDYHSSLEEYFSAKMNILNFQEPNDVAIFSADLPESEKVASHVKGQIIRTSRLGVLENSVYLEGDAIYRFINSEPEKVVEIEKITLPGDFNLENIMASIAATSVAGASIEAMQKVLTSFTGLPHRLQLVRTVKGVEYWNNSYATAPDATIGAIKSFEKPIILMLGGYEKGFNYDELAEAIVKGNVKTIIGIGENSRNIYEVVSLFREREGLGLPVYVEGGENMAEMVKSAQSVAESGDIVMLSPAAASFDKFKNVTDRGEQFICEVNKL